MPNAIQKVIPSQVPEDEGRKTRISKIRVIAFALPGLLLVGLLAYGMLKASPKVKPGAEAPSFDLEKLDGSGRITSDQLRGEPVVINFWASWCVPCREEAPRLEKAWKKYRDEGITFLGVDLQDAREDGLAFVKEFGLTFPQVRDPNSQAAGAFGVTGLPETFFIDQRWRFLAISEGASTGEQRGNLVIRGAISSAELRSYVDQLVRRTSQEQRDKRPSPW